MNRLKVFLCFFFISAMYFSCTSDDGDVALPSLSAADDTSLINLTYNNDIKPILASYCYGTGGQRCHVPNTNQSANGDYTFYAGIKSKVDNGTFQLRVLNPGGGMPPVFSNGPQTLAPIDMNKLKAWVNEGAREN